VLTLDTQTVGNVDLPWGLDSFENQKKKIRSRALRVALSGAPPAAVSPLRVAASGDSCVERKPATTGRSAVISVLARALPPGKPGRNSHERLINQSESFYDMGYGQTKKPDPSRGSTFKAARVCMKESQKILMEPLPLRVSNNKKRTARSWRAVPSEGERRAPPPPEAPARRPRSAPPIATRHRSHRDTPPPFFCSIWFFALQNWYDVRGGRGSVLTISILPTGLPDALLAGCSLSLSLSLLNVGGWWAQPHGRREDGRR
jgi:hypothetical protein